MSEAEQAINVIEWKKLHAELEEVRDKRDQLYSQNLRVTEILRCTIEERDKAVKVNAAFQDQVASLQEQLQKVTLQRDNALANTDSLRAEYRKAKEAANANSDKAAALLEQVAGMDVALRDMTAQRDHAKAQWEECCGDRSRQATVLREHLAEITALQEQLRDMTVERDAALAKVEIVMTERDAAERERTESRAEVVQLQFERDAARKFADDTQVQLSQWQVGHDAVKEQLARAKEEADMLEQENTLLQDTICQLRAKQIHDDLPGLLRAIHLAAEQAWELI